MNLVAFAKQEICEVVDTCGLKYVICIPAPSHFPASLSPIP